MDRRGGGHADPYDMSIKSSTTLQKLRHEGKIRFSQPQKKIILYDRGFIMEYIEGHVRETF